MNGSSWRAVRDWTRWLRALAALPVLASSGCGPDEYHGLAVDAAGTIYASAENAIFVLRGPYKRDAKDPQYGGEPGWVDGPVAAARFNAPGSLAIDAAGNLYVADAGNYAIRKVSPNGVVTTVAGTIGVAGSADGPAREASFGRPGAMAVSRGGEAYVADEGNHTIRKITAGGMVVTLAGDTGHPGWTDGVGVAARFGSSLALAVDLTDTVYVAEGAQHTVRKITPDGRVTTIAGRAGEPGSINGTGTAARFNRPTGVVADSSGNLYVMDTGNALLRKLTRDGRVTTLSSFGGRWGSFARVFTGRWPLERLEKEGEPFRFDSTDEAVLQLILPHLLTARPNGDLYFTHSFDSFGFLSPAGRVTWIRDNHDFDPRGGIAADADRNLYLAESGLIEKVGPSGEISTLAGHSGSSDEPRYRDGHGQWARFGEQLGVARSPDGTLYVADPENNVVRRVTPDGEVTTLAGAADKRGFADGVGGAARFNAPASLTVDGHGTVYVVDRGNDVIRRISAARVVTTIAGSPGRSGSEDGVGHDARFNAPGGIAIDRAGNLWVADSGNSTIRRVTPAGRVSTIAGRAGEPGGSDGRGTQARFDWPTAITADCAGRLYVTDVGNATIRRITPDGDVATIAGVPLQRGMVDGTGTAAWFAVPDAITLDRAGTVYVFDAGDRGGGGVRHLSADGAVTSLAPQWPDYSWRDFAADSVGNLYVTDGRRVGKIRPDGGYASLREEDPAMPHSPGDPARFAGAVGLAIGPAGQVVVADPLQRLIRRIASDGGVTTLAGGIEQPGSRDGPSVLARFDRPLGVATDSRGFTYVADAGNHTIRMVAPDGWVSTLAGSASNPGSRDGPGARARFRSPVSLAVDADFNVYVADAGNSVIRRISRGGVVTTLAGSAGRTGLVDGTGAAARFYGPTNIGVDGSGNVYVLDAGGSVLRRITPTGIVTTVPRSTGTPVWAVDRRGERLQLLLWEAQYTMSERVALVERTSADGTSLARVTLTEPVDAPSQPRYSQAIAVDERGRLYLTSSSGRTIVRATSEGKTELLYDSVPDDSTSGPTHFGSVEGIVLDESGQLWVTDSKRHTVTRITAAGEAATVAGMAWHPGLADGAGAAARLYGPTGIARDPAGYLFVSDSGTNVIRRITPSGDVSTFAGRAGESGTADGVGPNARFNSPHGLAIDRAGNLYVADTDNHLIREISPAGAVSTLAGTAGQSGAEDGAGLQARFKSPVGVAVDRNGTVYVADSGNHTVRTVSTRGDVATLAGDALSHNSRDGVGTAAHFRTPNGIAVDHDGNVYVTELGGEQPRRITPAGVVTTLKLK
jgi:mucin-19